MEEKPYNARQFFDSWYSSALNAGEFSDRITLSPNYTNLMMKYHYNLVENLIIEFLHDKNISKPNILDIGSGTGHWLEFYHQLYPDAKIIGLDISEVAVKQLNKKLKNKNIEVMCFDISKSFNPGINFHIVNAIGVMFHIVEDIQWENAIENISKVLVEGGYFIVSGKFGETSENVQRHASDNFKSWDERKKLWEEIQNKKNEVVLVNKRIRSLKYWIKTAAKYNLYPVDFMKQPKLNKIKTPENNLLVFIKESPNL
ncbi:MAG: hypothetical protein KatS3mg034_1119 [Vicingaceae bacterium]|nr:MAG: hypothetical protein KatS3mg028_1610 [Bacteroidia bacterium]GIV41809.1 MAG: hypothetical protein KatS3mg034_1119 [Vicingaceae bacterium]